MNHLKAYASEYKEERIKIMKLLYNFLLVGAKIEKNYVHSWTNFTQRSIDYEEELLEDDHDWSFSSTNITTILSDRSLETEL